MLIGWRLTPKPPISVVSSNALQNVSLKTIDVVAPKHSESAGLPLDERHLDSIEIRKTKDIISRTVVTGVAILIDAELLYAGQKNLTT